MRSEWYVKRIIASDDTTSHTVLQSGSILANCLLEPFAIFACFIRCMMFHVASSLPTQNADHDAGNQAQMRRSAHCAGALLGHHARHRAALPEVHEDHWYLPGHATEKLGRSSGHIQSWRMMCCRMLQEILHRQQLNLKSKAPETKRIK